MDTLRRSVLTRIYQSLYFSLSRFFYLYFIPIVYIFILAILVLISNLEYLNYFEKIEVISSADPAFLTSFFEGFSVIYAFSLPIVITKTWEQFDTIRHEFNNEANTVNMLYESVLLIHPKFPKYSVVIRNRLMRYVRHVIHNYEKETSFSGYAKGNGDSILTDIKEKLYQKTISRDNEEKINSSLFIEINQRLDDLQRIRNNRISLSEQSGFGIFRLVGLITSIIFIIPIYVVGFNSNYGLLVNLIIIAITFLVIYIYALVEAFSGVRRLDAISWYELRKKMICSQRDVQITARNKKSIKSKNVKAVRLELS